MKYAEAVDWLAARPQPKHWRLERMRRLVKAAGVETAKQEFVHVAGSNGKGSVCAMLDSILRAEGRSTGFYSSPHLVDYPERIRVNGEPISRREFARLVEWVRPFAERAKASHFEALTAMALKHFSDVGVEFVVLETGLGGRLDATNVVRPAVSVITTVSVEHSEHLGRTVGRIAREKAGIVKRGAPVVTPCSGRALEVIRRVSKAKGSRLVRVSRPKGVRCTVKGTRFSWRGAGWRVRLTGDFQALNACTALEAARLLGVSEKAMRNGLASVEWPGRMQRFGRFLLDGCHNPESARAFVRAVNCLWPGGQKTLVTGVLADKDYEAVAVEFSRLAGVARVIAVEPSSPRALSAASWRAVLASKGLPARSGKGLPRALSTSKGFTLVCGSLFLVGEALKLFKAKK